MTYNSVQKEYKTIVIFLEKSLCNLFNYTEWIILQPNYKTKFLPLELSEIGQITLSSRFDWWFYYVTVVLCFSFFIISDKSLKKYSKSQKT